MEDIVVSRTPIRIETRHTYRDPHREELVLLWGLVGEIREARFYSRDPIAYRKLKAAEVKAVQVIATLARR